MSNIMYDSGFLGLPRVRTDILFLNGAKTAIMHFDGLEITTWMTLPAGTWMDFAVSTDRTVVYTVKYDNPYYRVYRNGTEITFADQPCHDTDVTQISCSVDCKADGSEFFLLWNFDWRWHSGWYSSNGTRLAFDSSSIDGTGSQYAFIPNSVYYARANSSSHVVIGDPTLSVNAQNFVFDDTYLRNSVLKVEYDWDTQTRTIQEYTAAGVESDIYELGSKYIIQRMSGSPNFIYAIEEYSGSGSTDPSYMQMVLITNGEKRVVPNVPYSVSASTRMFADPTNKVCVVVYGNYLYVYLLTHLIAKIQTSISGRLKW